MSKSRQEDEGEVRARVAEGSECEVRVKGWKCCSEGSGGARECMSRRAEGWEIMPWIMAGGEG